jgi:hypothetical protein
MTLSIYLSLSLTGEQGAHPSSPAREGGRERCRIWLLN